MENITIRPMQPDDVMLCADMIASTLPWQRYGVTSERAGARLREALQRDSALLVAQERDGNRLGFVWLLRHGAFDLSGYIRWIVVSPTHRSGGVGRLLLAAAEE